MTHRQRSLKFRRSAALFLSLLAAWPVIPAATPNPQKASDAASSAAKALGSITVQVPKGWIEQSPSSQMRKLQYSLPRVKGDAEDGELAVFNFGPGQGGSVEANIDRWVGQFKQPDATPSQKRAKIEKRQISGLPVTTVDVKGTYQAAAMGMPAQGSGKPNYRMLAAIVQAPEGAYFIKLTGPEKTIEHWATSFQQFVNSIRKR